MNTELTVSDGGGGGCAPEVREGAGGGRGWGAVLRRNGRAEGMKEMAVISCSVSSQT